MLKLSGRTAQVYHQDRQASVDRSLNLLRNTEPETYTAVEFDPVTPFWVRSLWDIYETRPLKPSTPRFLADRSRL